MVSRIKSPIKYHGGKSRLAKRIIDLLPERDENFTHFHETCFGGGAVTFALDPEGLSETVNDVNYELMNFWRILSNHIWAGEFIRVLSVMPFSEEAFRFAKEFHEFSSEDGDYLPLRRAIAFFIRNRQSRQALEKDYATPTTRIRGGMNEHVSAWLSAVESLPEVHSRLRRIEIRNLDVCDFIRKYDHKKAVFYIDPPYLFETRSSTNDYTYEMTFEEHGKLLAVLGSIDGRFLLSGYPSESYDEAADAFGWNRTDIKVPNSASSKKKKDIKTECVWRNFK